ncbi:hypothetical protein DLH72_05010 [Candidatus Gracilibacteria bacterium]|nr:MAG: hypothetical protein DLH72_05010 [Candidatus Gracilibacteria bacterium]
MLKIGNQNIKNIKLGNNGIKAVYQGSNLIWKNKTVLTYDFTQGYHENAFNYQDGEKYRDNLGLHITSPRNGTYRPGVSLKTINLPANITYVKIRIEGKGLNRNSMNLSLSSLFQDFQYRKGTRVSNDRYGGISFNIIGRSIDYNIGVYPDSDYISQIIELVYENGKTRCYYNDENGNMHFAEINTGDATIIPKYINGGIKTVYRDGITHLKKIQIEYN